MKLMFLHQKLTEIPKYFPRKIPEPCTICYQEKMTIFPKSATIDKTNFHPGELLYLDFSLYNDTSIYGFTIIITAVCVNTIMLGIFPTVSNQAIVRIVRFILTKLKNDQHSCKHLRVGEDGAL